MKLNIKKIRKVMLFQITLWQMFVSVKEILSTQFLYLLCKKLASKFYAEKEALKILKIVVWSGI